MKLIKAHTNDLEVVKELYRDIIDHTANMEKYARWKRNLHPTDEKIEEYVKNDAMYLFMDGEKIAGAMAVTMSQGEDYHNIDWNINATDEEVAVIHILGVTPEYQGKGVGKQMIDEVIHLAKDSRKRVVRLDALATNTPAQQLYQGKGFSYCGKVNLYAENTGWTDFFFYEYVL